MSAQVYEFKSKKEKEMDELKKVSDKLEEMAIFMLESTGVKRPPTYGWFLDMKNKMIENDKVVNSFTKKECDDFMECSLYWTVLMKMELVVMTNFIS